jgi:hypothetical protein
MFRFLFNVDEISIENLNIFLIALLPLFSLKNGNPSIPERIILFKEIERIISLAKLSLESFVSLRENIQKDIKEIQLHALRSAVAAIMARNMSHNIGSHVLAKMGYVNLPELNLPQSQIFYKYAQQRMDFVAVTSTEFPEWSYPTWFLKELMRWFYQQETLLEYIARQERIKSSYKWAENENHEKNKNTLLIRIRYNDKWIIPKNPPDSRSEGLETDFSLAIPGGIIGYHAFYVILEDIIRNSAKHEWASLSEDQKKEKKQLKITIDIGNQDESHDVTFKIYDNISETKNNSDPLPADYEKLDPEAMENFLFILNEYLSYQVFYDGTGH